MNPPAPVLQALHAARRVVIATHSPMDGDGLGCGLALQRCLRARGKECLFLTEAPVPPSYLFLPGADGIVLLEKSAPLPEADLLLGLDAGDPERLGRAWAERAPDTVVLNIDHHRSNPRYGDAAWVDPEAAATGELVFELLTQAGCKLDPVAAQCLLVALATDTGRFCYSSTTARTLEVAAALVRAGAEPDGLQRNLYGALPVSVLTLKARAVKRLQFFAGATVCMLVVPEGFGADLGVNGEAVRDLVDLAIGVKGVLVAALVRGLPGGGAKVSLRSMDDRADVAALAAARGGGGHLRAAGFSSDLGPEETAAGLRVDLERLAVAASG